MSARVEQDLGYRVIVAGAGALLEEKLAGALELLGPTNQRVIFDIKRDRVLAQLGKGPRLVQADAIKIPFSIDKLTPEQKRHVVVFVATPNHLETVTSFVGGGFRKFIVEKPMVNDGQEVTRLEAIKQEVRDLQVVALDFYFDKVIPLRALFGKLPPDDPRWNWVTNAHGQEVNKSDLVDAVPRLIGEIEGIEVTILEGGNLGAPDIIKRPWLRNDQVRGGMWLDLGTHALGPLVLAGLMSADTTTVVNAERYKLNEDMTNYVPLMGDEPEMYGHALLTSTLTGRQLPIEVTVGKTFHEGGVWTLVIRGNKGHCFMNLRTGGSLVVIPNDGELVQLRLRAGSDPYVLAMEGADLCFKGENDGNMQAMLDAIEIAGMIKIKSKEVAKLKHASSLQ